MIKVLFTTPIINYPYAGGPEMSVHNAIKALSSICELHVLPRVYVHKKTANYYAGIVDIFTILPRIKAFHYNNWTKSFLFFKKVNNLVGSIFSHFIIASDANFILTYCDKYKIDVIWFDRHEFSFDLIVAVRIRNSKIKIVCDTAAVQSEFILRELPFQQKIEKRKQILKLGNKFRKEEELLVQISNVVTAVSERDADIFRSYTIKPNKIKLFPNVVDLDAYQRNENNNISLNNPCLVATGTFYSIDSPMAHGCRWVINEVLPKVKEKFPGLHFYIVGKGSESVFSSFNDPGITITGKVLSVLPYISKANVCLVPLFYESGTRFKILEYGAVGCATISTSLGAEGLELENGKSIIIADDASAFANAIIEMLNNKEQAKILGMNLFEIVQNQYSLNTLKNKGESVLDYLIMES